MEEYQIEQRIQIDFSTTGVPPRVFAKQYDSNMRVVAVDMYNSGQPYTVPPEYSVNIRLDKRDGHHVYNPALFGSGNTVFVLLTQQMLTHPGELLAELEVVQVGNAIKTATFVIACAPSVFPDDQIQSTDEYKTIQEIYELIKDAAGIVEENIEIIKNIPEQIEDIKELVGRVETAADAASDSAEAAEAAKADVAKNAAAAGEAAASAADSRDEAKHYADLALQATGYRGWFATGADLREKYPTGEDGWWAVVGATDTIWVWDSDTGRWKDSGSGSIGSVNAEDVTYDNTKSGLPVDNVQDAIDQLDSSITGFVSKTTEFSADGKTITETFGEREIVTAFESDTVITQQLFVGGQLSATKTTTFEVDGSIKEEII